ncbi:small ubiquitin-related modifier [Haematococcus lacustris]|uniref:Small ubiquitin-related modifier n=1 Tax=Haematococcus lacustris TaxID=44745 RepID=A0A699ZDB9_HAELA|nr:small ubiquitin-related modifier [Haematococcus lacustris]
MADGDEEAGQSGAPEPKREAADIISLIVRDQQGSEVMFKVKPHTKLQKVSPITHVRHMPGPLFLFDGARIEDDNTPTSLHMEEGDRIDCVVEQIGGGGHSRERPVPASKILL